jgi:hypothetical protein
MKTIESTSNKTLSFHAQGRLRQRGIKNGDLEVVRSFGEPVADGYLMSDKAIEHRKHELQRQLQQLERLRGLALIEASDCVVTIYRADNNRVKRLRAGPIKH